MNRIGDISFERFDGDVTTLLRDTDSSSRRWDVEFGTEESDSRRSKFLETDDSISVRLQPEVAVLLQMECLVSTRRWRSAASLLMLKTSRRDDVSSCLAEFEFLKLSYF